MIYQPAEQLLEDVLIYAPSRPHINKQLLTQHRSLCKPESETKKALLWIMPRKRVNRSRMLDRISNLPNNVIDIILSLVPLRDVVRTSILSKKWRLHWTRVENLVLDENFKDDIEDILYGEEDEMQASIYLGIVANILLSHSGPIRQFFLHVPYFDDDISDDINLWILNVSRHGVQDLTLHYYDYDYDRQVPSYLFQCTELKHLSLGNVKIPPQNFEGLSSLLSLDLECNVISQDLLEHVFLNCPLLERLSLCHWGNDDSFETFVFDASKLKDLCLTFHNHLDFILKNAPNLSTISLQFTGSRRENRHIKCPDIFEFFGDVPKLEKLTLTGLVLEEWGVPDVPKMLPDPLENHLHLTIDYRNMYSLAQVRSMLCLINSSPKLQTLDILSLSKLDSPSQVTSEYLKLQLREGENLWSLKTVKFAGLNGMEPEILFIKLILSCCPVLEKLYLTSQSCITLDAELKMMTDIMRFRRASALAETIYSRQK